MTSYVYMIESENGETKIGLSNKPEARLGELQVGNPFLLYVGCTIEFPDSAAAQKAECLLHFLFNDRHIRGEWFDISADEAQQKFVDVMTLAALVSLNSIQSFDPPDGYARNTHNRTAQATESVLRHLQDNPDDARLTVRELGEMVGVGKDSAAKAKQRFTNGD